VVLASYLLRAAAAPLPAAVAPAAVARRRAA
jgi:hypothetical protein